jgi:hypothetical protein
MSSFENGSTGASSKRGPGTFFIGLGSSSSLLVHEKRADRLTQKLWMVLGERGA